MHFLEVIAYFYFNMKRKAYLELLDWKRKAIRKPLIIQGARQVGKTWLMKEFGRNEFVQTAYFNFESTKNLAQIFEGGYDIPTIIRSLNILAGFTIEAEKTLIIFDEIQSCPEAITSLKYFNENHREYFILAAGSLLGVAIHRGVSFPVGKVEFMTLHPLNFSEFMEAGGKQDLLQAVSNNDYSVIEHFHEAYISSLKDYYFTGGMPEVVNQFLKNQDYNEARRIQQQILLAYENDFSKHAPINQLPRIRMIWQSIVGQLAKENSKFIYTILRTGARAKEFELAIEWLKDAGLIHKVIRIEKPGMPLSAYADWTSFKIYLHDVGLLCAMAEISPEILLKGDDLFTEFKGVVSEQYVLQQMISHSFQPFYWAPENSKAELDFVIQAREKIIPVEVKSATNLKSRSLRLYYDKYHPEACIRTSLSGFQKQEWMENIPLFAFAEWLVR